MDSSLSKAHNEDISLVLCGPAGMGIQTVETILTGISVISIIITIRLPSSL